MFRDIKKCIIASVSADEFYASQLDDYKSGENAPCPFHQDSTPSLSTRKEDGAFFCHGCGAKGTSIIGFYEAHHAVTYKEATQRIFAEYIAPTVPSKLISRWLKELMANSPMRSWIERERGVNLFTMKSLKLGWDGERIVIPIINEYGLCINVRRYHAKAKPKIISYKHGYGKARLFPLQMFRDDEPQVLLVEGEWDAILAWQCGFNALTSTGGANNWPDEFNAYFKGKDVVICYDNDEAGQAGARLVAKSIGDAARSIKSILLPVDKQVKDFTNFVVHTGAGRKEILRLVRRARYIKTPPGAKSEDTDSGAPEGETHINVKLHDASSAEHYYRPLSTTAHISGKRLTPFMVPKKFTIRCKIDRGRMCRSCHMSPREGVRTFSVKPNDRRLLQLVDASDTNSRRALRDIARVPHQCSTTLDISTTRNIEEITLIPPIDELGGSYTARRAYYVGHGLPSNRSYLFSGFTIPHPADQSATHVFTEAIPAQTQLENYVASEDSHQRMLKFHPIEGQTISEKIQEIELHLADHVTKIIERPVMHLAIDLVFHSPLQMYFNNEKLNKGWLEVAIIGDTRCGKGFVATELLRLYGLGEIATAENCSFAGLIGGLMKMGNTFSISWGIIPRNTGRLVIIDETSGLRTDDIAKMTRVRSEGVAEIFKIMSEATQARTRIIWLSNTRTGRPVNTYAYGVEAVSELFGKSEDISKLDYSLVVRGGDVAAETINAIRTPLQEDSRYDREDFRNLVMWIWTRTPSQIFFTRSATRYILEAAVEFGQRYHSSIPLVQVEDIRVKLARVSAAVAGRIFNADETGKNLVVSKRCAEYAVSFLQRIYDHPPTAYLAYSEAQFAATSIGNPEAVRELLLGFGPRTITLVRGLVETRTITITDVADFTGCDKFKAKEVIGELVRRRCLVKEYTYYVKRPAFIDFLRRME